MASNARPGPELRGSEVLGGHGDNRVVASPVAILLDAVATPLVLCPVARVPEGLGSLGRTVQDPKPMPQASLEVASVHLLRAVPGGFTEAGLTRLPGHPGPPRPPSTATEGHLLTDAVALHGALLPVALVTVELVLDGLGHQVNAKAAESRQASVPTLPPGRPSLHPGREALRPSWPWACPSPAGSSLFSAGPQLPSLCAPARGSDGASGPDHTHPASLLWPYPCSSPQRKFPT